ncbi:beta-phosphoglucomutase family hydrolase [Adhaeribacter soli]|uniref:Beta-phosphoglucomutase n=1 Tax=Adhaeribacter soli TaxID=2607655 RepID=A0A5N1IYT9_9BACT|nr:beta-phosphoglucomutase family hydrolase [Adhaeribacter soli]
MRALIFDMDGVVTQTATLHAQAWKKLFDDFLQNRREKTGKSTAPFRIETDYPQYIDGIPRLDGIRNFLKTRGISLPEGSPEDSPETETVWGLGNRKNQYFQELIKQKVEVFSDTLTWIKQKRAAGYQIAIISASKNCQTILQAAGIEDLFRVRVDGIVAEELHLPGKPAPDVFLEAARQLGVMPEETAVFEDARLGVKAARAGGFGLVVGVNRKQEAETEALLRNGADLVLTGF